MASFVSRFDFRAPGADRKARQELYTRALDQAAYLDEHGHDALMVSEHHVSDDGYLPSPLVVAAAMVARTRTLPITVSALLVNMYEPVKLAEDVAVLDHLSAGRVSYTLGLGYRPEEYALFGRAWETRGADIEERIELLLALWRGEEVEHDGRRVRLTPLPFSEPHPFLFYGGGTPAAARRAARLGLNFQPNVADKALRELYNEECRRHGREPGFVLLPPPGPATVFCAEDPERFWAEYGEFLLADAMAYRAWSSTNNSLITDDSSTVEELRAGGRFLVRRPRRDDPPVPRARAARRLVPPAVRRPARGALVGEPAADLRAGRACPGGDRVTSELPSGWTLDDTSAEEVERERAVYEPFTEKLRELVDLGIRSEVDLETGTVQALDAASTRSARNWSRKPPSPGWLPSMRGRSGPLRRSASCSTTRKSS